jgi:hypothetical protein
MQSVKQFLFHFFYPFSIPAVAAIDGWQANSVVSQMSCDPQGSRALHFTLATPLAWLKLM